MVNLFVKKFEQNKADILKGLDKILTKAKENDAEMVKQKIDKKLVEKYGLAKSVRLKKEMGLEKLLEESKLQEFYENLKKTEDENEAIAKAKIDIELLKTFGQQKLEDILKKMSLENFLKFANLQDLQGLYEGLNDEELLNFINQLLIEGKNGLKRSFTKIGN